MRISRLSFWGLLFVFALVLGGCAAPSKKNVRILWPPPPADPKLEWLGVYSSELDLPRTGLQQSLDSLTGAGGEQRFVSPVDVVSDASGRVYVSDMHLRNVRVFDFNRSTVGDLAAEGIFKSPAGLALDVEGNLYVADFGHGKVMVFSAAGNYLSSFGSADNIQTPTYVAVNDRLQRIYVSDSQQGMIFVFDMQYNYLHSIGKQGIGEGELYAPQGLAFDRANNLYVADYLNARIVVFTADGEFVRMFGTRGDQLYNFEGPRDLSFDSDGNLHIVDSRKGLLLTYSPEGQLLLSTGGGANPMHPLSFATPKGISIDGNDRVFIADQLTQRFTAYQFLSKKHLEINPVTEEDLRRLMDYLNQQ